MKIIIYVLSIVDISGDYQEAKSILLFQLKRCTTAYNLTRYLILFYLTSPTWDLSLKSNKQTKTKLEMLRNFSLLSY
jgi:hypothetical protein